MEQEDGRRKREAEGPVVVLECVSGSSKAEEWGGGGAVVQEGDVVEAVRMGRCSGAASLDAPFKGRRDGLQKALHAAFKRGDTSVEVRVRGGRELQACILPPSGGGGAGTHGGGGRKQYVLRSLHDPNYVLAFADRLESECLVLQGTRSTRVASALSKAQLQDGYVAYPWEKKRCDSLRMPNSSCYLSMLVLPKALDTNACRYESFEDTLARANAWFYSSQASGIPIEFMNVQSEALLTKISGETASATVNSGSLSDLSNVTNATLYGFEDYHGVDIGVVKVARLWYSSMAGEMPLEIPLQEGDTRLGFAVLKRVLSIYLRWSTMTTTVRHHQHGQGSAIYSTGPKRHRNCWSYQGCPMRRSSPGLSPVQVQSVASTPSLSAKSSPYTALRFGPSSSICSCGRSLLVLQGGLFVPQNCPHIRCFLRYPETPLRAWNLE